MHGGVGDRDHVRLFSRNVRSLNMTRENFMNRILRLLYVAGLFPAAVIALSSAASAQPPPPVREPAVLSELTPGAGQMREESSEEKGDSETEELGFSIATEPQATPRVAPARKGPAEIVNSGDEPSFGTDPIAQ